MKTLEELKAMINATEDNFEKCVLINNYKAVLYSDQVIDKVFEVLNKYAGKKIGKATMEKINAELSTAYPDLRVYISTEYDGNRKEISVYRRSAHFISYHDDIRISRKDINDRNLFDNNCNFKKLEKENCFIIGMKNYIEDVKEYMIMKKQQFAAVQNLVDDYEKLCKIFRDNKVDGLADLPWICKPYYITER